MTIHHLNGAEVIVGAMAGDRYFIITAITTQNGQGEYIDIIVNKPQLEKLIINAQEQLKFSHEKTKHQNPAQPAIGNSLLRPRRKRKARRQGNGADRAAS